MLKVRSYRGFTFHSFEKKFWVQKVKELHFSSANQYEIQPALSSHFTNLENLSPPADPGDIHQTKISAHQTVYNLKMLDNVPNVLFSFFFQPTRMLTVDSPWAYTSASKQETFHPPVSTDVPLTLKPWVTTALKVLNWDMDDELNFREMLSSSIWQLMTHLVLFIAYLSQRKCCDLLTVNIPEGKVIS